MESAEPGAAAVLVGLDLTDSCQHVNADVWLLLKLEVAVRLELLGLPLLCCLLLGFLSLTLGGLSLLTSLLSLALPVLFFGKSLFSLKNEDLGQLRIFA